MFDWVSPMEGVAYFLFRVIAGLLFASHGAQKLFGLFGGQKVALLSLLGGAGVIELVAGVCIAVGLFIRPLALLSVVTMIVAYVMVHAPKGWIPIENGGELALLYFVTFLVIASRKTHDFDANALMKMLKGH